MRYIDADKLKSEFDFKHIDMNKTAAFVHHCNILEIIDKQPTADVRENVQLDVCPLYGGVCGYPSGECYDCPRHGNFRENVMGEWIADELTGWLCSNCGEHIVLNVKMHGNYCPNCGAKMIRGEQNG